MKKELEEKENVAEAKRMELLRQAGIEHLRLQFGKKPTPTCKSLQERASQGMQMRENHGRWLPQINMQSTSPAV